jgi:hypothetical protein
MLPRLPRTHPSLRARRRGTPYLLGVGPSVAVPRPGAVRIREPCTLPPPTDPVTEIFQDSDFALPLWLSQSPPLAGAPVGKAFIRRC